MNLENSEKSNLNPSLPEHKSAAQTLSESVFSDPAAFLKTLQNGYSKITGPSEDAMSKGDLLLYSETGTDKNLAAAAKIAYDHYDDLQAMAFNAGAGSNDQHDGIDNSDLSLDRNLLSGNLGWTSFEDRAVIGTVGALATGVSIFGGFVTFDCAASGVMVPAAVALGAASVGMAGIALKAGHDVYTLGSDLQSASVKDQQMMAGWNEINSRKA